MLDTATSGSSKLILQDFQNSNEHTFQIGALRIDIRNLKQLFNRNDFIQEGFIKKIDRELLQGFTVHDQSGYDNDVKIIQDKVVFSRNLKIFSWITLHKSRRKNLR